MQPDAIYLRVVLLFLHALINFIFISWLTDFDITGSWLTVIGFAFLVLLVIGTIMAHVISFINYIKTKTK
ncbi:hypothetical protein [Flavihumibacter solisilvae]|jgi:hypothetical protein|uniref:Uncharacterized protein n=1 Tax=Flavihumibacter solisilvae TaxID=1349421 RepID=A0A0C1LKE6_9BACT|nr:hypothetical protein [Flavihumibacter solisilvae]KIC95838.1 hypothetical protein OI18_04190 [Flavihumibacter solisilvae]